MNGNKKWLCLLACSLFFISVGSGKSDEYVKAPVRRRSIPSSMEDDRLKKELRRRQHDLSDDTSSGTMEDDRLKKALRNHRMYYGTGSIGTMEDDNLKRQLRRMNRLYDSSSSSSSSGSMDDDRLKRSRYRSFPHFRRRFYEPNYEIEHYGNYKGGVVRHKTKDRNKVNKKYDDDNFRNHDTFKKKQADKFVKKRFNYPVYKHVGIPVYKKDT